MDNTYHSRYDVQFLQRNKKSENTSEVCREILFNISSTFSGLKKKMSHSDIHIVQKLKLNLNLTQEYEFFFKNTNIVCPTLASLFIHLDLTHFRIVYFILSKQCQFLRIKIFQNILFLISSSSTCNIYLILPFQCYISIIKTCCLLVSC